MLPRRQAMRAGLATPHTRAVGTKRLPPWLSARCLTSPVRAAVTGGTRRFAFGRMAVLFPWRGDVLDPPYAFHKPSVVERRIGRSLTSSLPSAASSHRLHEDVLDAVQVTRDQVRSAGCESNRCAVGGPINAVRVTRCLQSIRVSGHALNKAC